MRSNADNVQITKERDINTQKKTKSIKGKNETEETV